MTTHEQALRALAQAYDREDAAQRGEPDPWNLDDPGDIGDSDTWVSERLACAQVAAEAFLSALLPEDVAGLVERLMGENPDSLTAADRLRMFAHDPETFEFDQHDALSLIPTIEDAASLIQSQAARIAELEAGVSEFADPANWVVNGRFDPNSGNFDATTFARALLNKEAKGC